DTRGCGNPGSGPVAPNATGVATLAAKNDLYIGHSSIVFGPRSWPRQTLSEDSVPRATRDLERVPILPHAGTRTLVSLRGVVRIVRKRLIYVLFADLPRFLQRNLFLLLGVCRNSKCHNNGGRSTDRNRVAFHVSLLWFSFGNKDQSCISCCSLP